MTGAGAVALAASCLAPGQRGSGRTAAVDTDTNLPRASSPGEHRITYEELEQLTRGFADWYAATIFWACDQLADSKSTADQRRMAHLFRTVTATDVYDIVTNPDPFTQLLDLMVVVTLLNEVWIHEGRAQDTFGDRASLLTRALASTYEEVWDLGAKVMKPEQREVMERLIRAWRDEHPDQENVTFVRAADFSASRGKSTITNIPTGTGFLAPVDQAARAADELRLLSERAFYLAKRSPILFSWHAEALLEEVLLQPEVLESVSSFHTLADALERLPEDIASERQAIFAGLDERNESLGTTVRQLREAIDAGHALSGDVIEAATIAERIVIETRETSRAVQAVINAAERLTAPRPDQPQGAVAVEKPFEISEYTRAATELTGTLRELNTVLASTAGLLESQAWTKRLEEVSSSADARIERATTRTQTLIDRMFWRAAGLLVMLGVILAVLSWMHARWHRSAKA
jgi:hypothetical protein